MALCDNDANPDASASAVRSTSASSIWNAMKGASSASDLAPAIDTKQAPDDPMQQT